MGLFGLWVLIVDLQVLGGFGLGLIVCGFCFGVFVLILLVVLFFVFGVVWRLGGL